MEPVVIITVPACGVKEVHRKHVLRHGFLHLRRTKCEGWTVEEWGDYQYLLSKQKKTVTYTKKHKHEMFLSQWWTSDQVLVFICDWHPAGCKFEYRISRGLWQRQTINGLRAHLARQAVAPLFQAIRERVEDE